MDEKQPRQSSPLELTFPFYLDTEMLTGFLATLEDGFSLSSTVSEAQRSTSGNDRGGEASAGTASVISHLLRFDMSGNISLSDSAEDSREWQFVLQHTEVSLLNRLRNILIDREMVTFLDSESSELPPLGAIVEIEGVVEQNPLSQLLEMFQSMSGFLQHSKPKAQNKSAAQLSRSERKGNKTPAQANSEIDPSVILDLLESDRKEHRLTDVIVRIGSSSLASGIVTLRQSAATSESSEHFIDSRCFVLGKVSGVFETGHSIPLHRRSILRVIENEQVEQMFVRLTNSPGINLPLPETTVKGSAIQVLPLAIYV